VYTFYEPSMEVIINISIVNWYCGSFFYIYIKINVFIVLSLKKANA